MLNAGTLNAQDFFFNADVKTLVNVLDTNIGPAFIQAGVVTITIASPGVVSYSGNPLAAGIHAPVVFTTTGALPTGLTAGTIYYTLSETSTTFQVSATPGGSAINTSVSQSGTHTATIRSPITITRNVSTLMFESISSPHSGFLINDFGTVIDTVAQSQGSFSSVVTADADDSTKTPPSHGVLLALPNGNLVLIYQSGTQSIGGLVYRVAPSVDTGFIQTGIVTMTIASPCVVTYSTPIVPNGLHAPVVFATTGALPTGLTAGTTYYTLNETPTTFQVSSTPGGSAINTTGSQSGTQTATINPDIQISTRTDIYPTAVVQRDNNDIHLCYSMDEPTPTLATTRSVYYRRLVYTSTSPATPTFSMGAELNIMPGSSSLAYTRATIDIDDNNVPFVAAVRYDGSKTAIACAIGAVAGNMAGAAISTNVTGLQVFTPDVAVASTAIQNDWFISVTSASTTWLTRAVGPNAGLQSITFNSVASFGTDNGFISDIHGFPNGSLGPTVYIVYIKNGSLYVRTWLTQFTVTDPNLLNNFTDFSTGTLGPEILITSNVIHAALANDGVYPWVFYIQRLGARQVAAFASASTNWSPVVLATSSSEKWDWPNTVSRLDDAQTACMVWSTSLLTPNKIYLGSSRFRIPKTVPETGVVRETVNMNFLVPEIMAGLDIASIALAYSDRVIIGDEDVSAFGNPKVYENATVTEEINKLSEIVDAMSLVEGLLDVAQTTTDTMSVNDSNVTAKNKVIALEFGTLLSEQAKTAIKAVDNAMLADLVSGVARIITDVMHGADIPSIAQKLSDAGYHGTDIASLDIIVPDVGTTTYLISRAIELLESGTLAEEIDTIRNLFDTGSMFEVARMEHIVREAASGLDTVSPVTIRAIAILLRLLAQYNVISLKVEGGR